ncbi:MAG: 23S rRNA (adenine(2503)-C(2))-methyltransferase RlmN [Pseudomonadota bacterium]|nr:23S rRNA (adenine(2503)-C(2))-methyltransferase RlmN [Pseudomonadota bacterium]
MSKSTKNIIGIPRVELEDLFLSFGEKPFRAKQLMRWMYHRNILDLAEMTDLSLSLRQALSNQFNFNLPKVSLRQGSEDGTVKWLLDVGRGQEIEMVFIPEDKRGTLCVSSQVGCVLDCPFCATGLQGFNRNLSVSEIIGQVVLAISDLSTSDSPSPISNIVFMGMGEPLANLRETVKACNLLIDDFGFGLSRRRVTVSTSGLVPQIHKLADLSNVALAVSLHASNDKLRNVLVPINRKHPIDKLLSASWLYAEKTNSRQITFEYIMLSGVNDKVSDAKNLAILLRNRPAKVNLIPFNPVKGISYERPQSSTIDLFREVLIQEGIFAITRRPRGVDINAACGQLAGNFDNRVLAPLAHKMTSALSEQ